MKKVLIILLIVVSAGGAIFVWRKNRDIGVIHEPVPSARVYSSTPTPKISPSQTILPATSYILQSEINLAVPFVLQAPLSNWDEVHEEFCEEASVLMAVSYVKGLTIPSPEFADQKLMEIKAFEEKRFGYYKDTTAEETAVIIRDFYGVGKVRVVYDPNIYDIKRSLSEGKTVIIPAAGRQLGNPYFTQPGPLYHMLIIKGYTKDGNFITNDPGTRHGADYIYKPDTLMNAIHDWNGGDVEHGRKVIIIIG